MDFVPAAADALGLARTFPTLAEEDFAVHNKYFGSAKFVGKPIMDELLALIRNTQGAFPQNDIINGPCEFFQRGGISAAVAMGDATYTGPDRFYSLIQAANATEQRVAAPSGFRSRYVMQLVSGGTTNRFGKATALEAYQSVPMRSQTKTFSFNVRASKNAGSGTINIRAAILEWTGTADAITKDVVNNWASGTYTAGNFFNSTTLNVIAVSPQIAVTHGVAQQVTLTGTFGASLNNAILMVWVQDVPAHAADLIQLSEYGLYQGTYAPTLWQPRPPANELALCQRYCYVLETTANGQYAPGLGYTDTASVNAYFNFSVPVSMRVTPISLTATASEWVGYDGSGSTLTAIALIAGTQRPVDTTNILLACTKGSNWSANRVFALYANGARKLVLDSEL